MLKITTVALLLLSQFAFSQDDKSPCLQNFEVSYQKIKDNYAGWNDKVTPSNQKKFDALTEATLKKVAKITDAEECYFATNDWLAFFEDGHLFINISSPYQKGEAPEDVVKRANKIDNERFKTEETFRAYLDSEKNLHAVTGMWESEDGMYKIGIIPHVKKKNKFNAFLLEKKDDLWVPGKVKFELEETSDGRFATNYLYADFTELKTFSRQLMNYLVIDKVYKYKKTYPVNEVVTNDEILYKLPQYRVEKINENTALLVLPPFTLPNAADLVTELVSKNRGIITSCENLIVDLRDNPGGDADAFVPLYPYISTGPILREGGIFRATEENIYLLEHELESIKSFPKYRRILEPKLKKVIADMKNNPGQEIKGPDKVFQYVSSMQNPQKVAILVNENTASSAEIVTLEAKQSTKTIVIGERTKGLADYIEVRDWGLPKYGWRLAFGLAKSSWMPKKPIDNKGISPDVKVPRKEADWVQYASNYLNK